MPLCLKIGVSVVDSLRSVFIGLRDLTTAKEKQKAEMQANQEQSQVEFESLGMEYMSCDIMWCESSTEELFVAFCVVTKLQIVLGTVWDSLHLEEDI